MNEKGDCLKIQINEGFPDIEIIINCPKESSEIDKLTSMLQNFGNKLLGIKDGQSNLIDIQNVFYFESVDKRYLSIRQTTSMKRRSGCMK